MNIIDFLKEQKKWTVSKYKLWKAYHSDYEEYNHWQYHNPNVKTQNALEAKILRQTHVIEKGMSLSHPREKFGVQKALELLDFIDEFVECGYDIKDSVPVLNALGVIKAYLAYHEERGFKPEDVLVRFEKYSEYLLTEEKYGIVEVNKADMEKKVHSSFPEFFMSRHSVRQFSERTIDIEDIKKAVKLAMKAPSACNRQSCKAYFYQDKDVNKELGKLIAGNTGFDGEVQNYIVVTSDMSAFYDPFERNQVYVDGGIFRWLWLKLSIITVLQVVFYKMESIRRKILSSKKSVRISRKTKKLFCSLPLGTIKITLHMLYHIERIWRMC